MPRKRTRRPDPTHPLKFSADDKQRAALPTRERQLGEPTKEREAHARGGFERQQLAAGAGRHDGVLQARVRAPLHHPDLRFEATARAVAAAIERNSPAIEPVKLTPTERQLDPVEHQALWWHMEWHLARETGNLPGANLSGSSGGGRPGTKLAIPEIDERQRRAWVAVSEAMPAAMLEFMDGFTAMHHAELRPEGTAPTLADLALQRGFEAADQRRLATWSEGYLKACADVIAHNRAIYETVTARKAARARQDGEKARQRRVLGMPA